MQANIFHIMNAMFCITLLAEAMPMAEILDRKPDNLFNLNQVCKGTFDLSVVAKLDRVCLDCDNLFTKDNLYKLCTDKCFTSKYFLGCVQSLMFEERLEEFKNDIKYIHGADP